MPDYRRYRVPGGSYFFTINPLERRSDRLTCYIDVLREAVRRTRRERPFHIDAWVVLPEYMHCIITLPKGDNDFSNRNPVKHGHVTLPRDWPYSTPSTVRSESASIPPIGAPASSQTFRRGGHVTGSA